MDISVNQIVLNNPGLLEHEGRDNLIWLNNALLLSPIYVAGLSISVLLGQTLYATVSSSKTSEDSEVLVEVTRSRFAKHVTALGGSTIFVFRIARLVACLALLGLAAPSTSLMKGGKSGDSLGRFDILYDGACAVSAYSSLLALVSIIGSAKWSRTCATHLVFVLLAPWALYIYRDVWPLCTFTLTPVDTAEGALIWVKVVILTAAAVVIPLTIPRQHTPVDSEDIPKEVSPTDTASTLSMMFHAYNDSVVYKANKVEHLKLDELPPLSDKDYTKNLVKKSYPNVDPLLKKNRHLALSLIFFVFRAEFLEMALIHTIRAFTSFLGPLGINRLLNYIETGGEGAVVRPWVWIIWLILGPALGSILMEWYTYRSTRAVTQCQAILTQLVFDHALRMRVKADAPKTVATSELSTAHVTPDNASVAESSSVAAAESSESADNDTVSVATSATKVQPAKGKASTAKTEAEDEEDKAGSSNNLVGKLTNLVTTDLSMLQVGTNFMTIIFLAPVQIALSMVILHSMLGWSVYPGLAAMALMIPIPGHVAKLLRSITVEKMKKSDTRVQSITETMNVIRMIKLFGWEGKTSDQLTEQRQDELNSLLKLRLLQLFNAIANNLIPLSTIIVTYGTYTVFMKQTLTASTVFSSMAIFDIIQDHFAGTFFLIPPIIQAKVSLDRINEFLKDTELLDQYTSNNKTHTLEIINSSEIESDTIGIREGSFTWAAATGGTTTPGSNQRNFTLRIDDEVFFKRGCINLVIGQTGSGKTSLLMALLGEMHYTPTGPNSVVSLPRRGGVAYHAQESWVLNESIRDNILFGAPFDEARYDAVIDQCGLKPDLAMFSAGDRTEVGEKGLTLSGGQKARVTLARAVYSSAEILLLDDVFAALDVHTAKWIVEKCFNGDLLHGRTVILVTHNVALASPMADFVVALSTDGRILSQGSLSNALAKDKKLQVELNKERQALEKDEEVVGGGETDKTTTKPNGQLIVEEEVALGHLSWSALKLYLTSMPGSTPPWVFWSIFLIFMLVDRVSGQLDAWILGLWASKYETVDDPSQVSVSYYLTLYSGVVAISFGAYAVNYSLWVFGSMEASRSLHRLLIDSILGTTLRWLDITPISRAIARCTQDIASIDGQFSGLLYYTLDTNFHILMKFGAVIVISPIFSIPGAVVILVVGCFGHLYMRAQLPVKRESSNAKAPVLGHFGSAISGLVSIRAYGAQAAFRKESYSRIDRFTRAQVTNWNLNRWVGIRSSMLAGLFTAGLAAYLMYGPNRMAASTTGYSLTMAVGFSSMIMWGVRLLNMTEIEGNSMERIQQYLTIEQEPKASKSGEAPAYWPASGDLRVENLSARYSVDGPKILHDITFHVKSGERVGIVGRTGSGKSSLTLALLRCIVTEGEMFYDGISTNALNLGDLRSNITIIPQVPELLSGTLRQNMDPFSQHDDAELNDALHAAGLFSLQSEDDENRITLDTAISGGGSNLSVGQRQILALARAIVRRSKLLILDEATSAIDYETDNVIQTSLRSKLDKDVTLLTVAHRLQTIMDSDRIMVLDSGRIAEFDKPRELLKNDKGFLRMLVDESGDREKLYAMANGTERLTV